MARAKTVVVSLVLMVSAINLLIADANQTTTGNRATEKHTNSTQQLPANKQQQQENNKSTIGLNRTSAETLESAPSITSVHHQVWTSSSSGRLDELSPEVISKLRNDVPFLAAYALRPRLVGSSVSALPSGIVAGGERTTASLVSGDGKLADVPYDAVTPPIGGESRLALVAPTPTNVMPLEVGASSPQAARQSLVPKLGDFSEFNVETSSLSKSEHHHKRKTSLKRPKSGRTEEGSGQLARLGRKRAVAEDSLSQLVRRVKRKLQQKQQTASNKRRASGGSSTRQQRSKKGFKSSRGRSKSNKRKSNKRRGASRRSRRTGKKRRNTRSARLLQEKPALGGAQNDLDDETQVRDQGVAGNDLGAATKGGGPVANPTAGGGDVKGGSPSGSPRKPPFHAAGQRPKQADKFPESADGETDRTIESGSGNAIDDAAADSTGRADGDRQADEDEEEEAELDDELEAEPKRVGDDDVEEDGDTVLVEPKSDGVDDDPPLPESPGEDADEADGGANGGDSTPGVDRDARDKEEPTTTPTPLAQPESDPRGNRVNRQKPNVLPSSSSAGDEQGGEGPGGQLAGGGGIGATVGGGSTAARPASGGASDRDQDQEAGGDDADDDEFGERAPQDGRKGTKAGAGGDSESGVEFADDNRSSERDGDDNNNEDVSRDRKELGDGDRGGKGRPDDGFDDDSRRTSSGGASTDGDFGERRQNGGPRREPADSGLADGGSRRPQTGLVGGDGDKDDDDDLDYRDEIDKPSSGRKGPAIDDSTDTEKEPRTTMTTTFNDSRTSTATSINATRGSHSKTDSHCDDGSYDHHGDHHHGGHGDSHHHHDTIDWLRGAIPGEPDDDYPILSRVNVTDFSCADQKHPGYYADVEARCQIFHICQADGRQDSFLCPNGTIFSQKSLVCVWWNGFHCEDAPKFYHLNELLYKTTNGNESPQAVALPNLRPLMDGAHLAPRSMKAAANDADDGDTANANEDDSPIDGMVKATKRGRGGPQESSFMGGEAVDGAAVNRDGGGGLMRGQAGARNNIGPDDDATIQRKSTNLDDDSVDEQPPARLRARDRVPRRRRRASMRQAPPKLKSRRVSRNSRRRKLRHGIKPRRRA